MLTRLVSKLFGERDELDELPEASSLSPFESQLMELAKVRIAYELKQGPLNAAQLTSILHATLDDDHDGDGPQQPAPYSALAGARPLETAMRAVSREARKIQRGPTKEEEMDECTFKPKINPSAKSPKSTRERSTRRNKAFSNACTMSTQDMREYEELQECTFTPNLHKHMARKVRGDLYSFNQDDPQYRKKRRDPTKVAAARVENYRRTNGDFDESLRLAPVDRPSPEREGGEIDWGIYVRTTDARFVPDDPGEEDVASRVFADTFLGMQKRGEARQGVVI